MYEEFGDWLFEARTGKKRPRSGKRVRNPRFTLEELAEKTGFSSTYISERERALPHPDTGQPVQPSKKFIRAVAVETGVDERMGRVLAGWPEKDALPTIEDVKEMFAAGGGVILDPREGQQPVTVISQESARIIAQELAKIFHKTPAENITDK